MPEIIEQKEKIWNPRYLKPEERGFTRKLYHAVFAEDTERFVDYYYQYKIRDLSLIHILITRRQTFHSSKRLIWCLMVIPIC